MKCAFYMSALKSLLLFFFYHHENCLLLLVFKLVFALHSIYREGNCHSFYAVCFSFLNEQPKIELWICSRLKKKEIIKIYNFLFNSKTFTKCTSTQMISLFSIYVWYFCIWFSLAVTFRIELCFFCVDGISMHTYSS